MNNLDPGSTNGITLQAANGNPLFTYWHQGGDNANGHYSDASTGNGTAIGFAYDYAQVDSFKFTLNSPTNYTFTDLSTGKSFSGKLSGAAISGVTFFRSNGSGTPTGGQDFKFSNLAITMTPAVPSPTLLSVGQSAVGWDFHFAVAPGYSYRMQRATNLMGPWADLGTLTGPATGQARFVDTNPPSPQSFYRTVSP